MSSTGEKKTIAETEGYLVITDNELMIAAENRVRQLEQDAATQQMYLEEAQAIDDEPAIKAHTDTLHDVKTRLTVTQKRLRSLRDAAEARKTKTPPADAQ